MYTYQVLVHGPKGYLECGLYRTGYITDASEVSERLADNLIKNGRIQLSHADGGCTVVFKESVLSFTVTPIKEAEK